jgi:hypothetical protein
MWLEPEPSLSKIFAKAHKPYASIDASSPLSKTAFCAETKICEAAVAINSHKKWRGETAYLGGSMPSFNSLSAAS